VIILAGWVGEARFRQGLWGGVLATLFLRPRGWAARGWGKVVSSSYIVAVSHPRSAGAAVKKKKCGAQEEKKMRRRKTKCAAQEPR
jgi:hypothetical protein